MLRTFMSDINARGRKKVTFPPPQKPAATLLKQPLSPIEKLKLTSSMSISLGAE
jgi:hypothetical protein